MAGSFTIPHLLADFPFFFFFFECLTLNLTPQIMHFNISISLPPCTQRTDVIGLNDKFKLGNLRHFMK